MGQISQIIGASARLATMYAEQLLVGVTPEMFARFARPGGVEVRSNHPAFIFGHLSLYPPRILQQLGKPLGEATCPPHYEALFKRGVECQDDPDATIYPPMAELTDRFFAGFRIAASAVENASDESLGAPNPAEGRIRELFPTLGGAFGHYLGGHVQSHLGQFSAWRRQRLTSGLNDGNAGLKEDET